MGTQGRAIEEQVGSWVRLQDLLSTPPPPRARQLEKRLGVATSPPPNGTCAFSAPRGEAAACSRRETSEGGTSFPAFLNYLCGSEL